MSDKKLVETIYGKYSKFDIYCSDSWGATDFYLYKDGKPWKSYSTLSGAVAEAKKH